MNGITHFAAGILCQLVVFALMYRVVGPLQCGKSNGRSMLERRPRAVKFAAYAVTAILAFFSHGFLDTMARYTYHDSSAGKWDNPFYAPWTYGMLAAAAVFGLLAILRDPRLAWGMMFALLPDLVDYNVIRVIEVVVLENPAAVPFSLHAIGSWGPVFDAMDVAMFGSRVSLNQDPSASIFEIALIVAMVAGILAINKRWPMPAVPAGREAPASRRVLLFVMFVAWISNDVWVGLLGSAPGGPGPLASVILSFAATGALLAILLVLHVRDAADKQSAGVPLDGG